MPVVTPNVSLENQFRTSRDNGKKLLVPYVTGGLTSDWIDVVRAIADAGADAIEIGIPFSDPIMDGPVIQEASQRALDRGITPQSIFRDVAAAQVEQRFEIPLVAMTYVNVAAHAGWTKFASQLGAAGFSGAILPDLPSGEAHDWSEAMTTVGLAAVQLVAPTTPDERITKIAEMSRGFVYAVGTMGVTGERSKLAESALTLARRVKALTNRPVLVGVGVSTPAQAAEVAAVADGVIVGSAMVRRLLDVGDSGGGAKAAAAFVGELRRALDRVS